MYVTHFSIHGIDSFVQNYVIFIANAVEIHYSLAPSYQYCLWYATHYRQVSVFQTQPWKSPSYSLLFLAYNAQIWNLFAAYGGTQKTPIDLWSSSPI